MSKKKRNRSAMDGLIVAYGETIKVALDRLNDINAALREGKGDASFAPHELTPTQYEAIGTITEMFAGAVGIFMMADAARTGKREGYLPSDRSLTVGKTEGNVH